MDRTDDIKKERFAAKRKDIQIDPKWQWQVETANLMKDFASEREREG